VVMYAAQAVEEGTVEEIFQSPKHPYTKALLGSVPNFAKGRGKSHGISGSPPSLINPPQGCRFHPRCPDAMDICTREDPYQTTFSSSQRAMCHLYDRQEADDAE